MVLDMALDMERNEGRPACGILQYSQALPARRRTTFRKLGPCLSGLFGEEAARLHLRDGNQIDGLNEILILASSAGVNFGYWPSAATHRCELLIPSRRGVREERSHPRSESLGQPFQ